MIDFEKCKYADSCAYELCVPEFCNEYEAVTMTNADRIRAMTDEELAEHFALLFIDTREGVSYSTDEDRWLDWLQEPYKGDAE